ncbi:Clavaminate synthase-like protein [Atractiella rhizophila]|nr:Clavaminate synthase-like protein [Atractiella rhizophila]
MADRTIPRVSFKDYHLPSRKAELVRELMQACEHGGFFLVVDHPIPLSLVEAAFHTSKEFFDLPETVKAETPFKNNMGWEYRAQLRPSTGKIDRKESIQIPVGGAGEGGREGGVGGRAVANNVWPNPEHFQGRPVLEEFMNATLELSLQLMSLLAVGLGIPEDTFTRATTGGADMLTTMRLLHYLHAEEGEGEAGEWRAGPHTDFDILTLLFQREGETGLEVCPGREVITDFAIGNEWTPVPADQTAIVCNIGDQLMYWSNDKLKSTFHRVRAPLKHERQGDRYSIAFFNAARATAMIETEKYEKLTGREFVDRAIKQNYGGTIQGGRLATS